jgi:hypothetical protein
VEVSIMSFTQKSSSIERPLHAATPQRDAASVRHSQPADPRMRLLALQRAIGNQAVLSLLRVNSALDGNRSTGKPLDDAIRFCMESRFGHDFADVQVHTDHAAAESAESLGAKAYTLGNKIVFGEGRYAPETLEGKRLLAHELTHVVQQSDSAHRPHAAPQHCEGEATQASRMVLQGGTPTVAAAAPVAVQCDPLEDELWKLQAQEKKKEPCPTCHNKPPIDLGFSADAPIRKWIKDAPPPKAAAEPSELDKVLSGNLDLSSPAKPRSKPEKIPLRDLLPPPRSVFEAKAFRQNLKRVRDVKGAIVGFIREDTRGLFRLIDYDGNQLAEWVTPAYALESPLLDPIDFIPFEALASLAAKGITLAGRIALKTSGGVIAKTAAEDVAKVGEKVVAEGALATGKPAGEEIWAALKNELESEALAAGSPPVSAGASGSTVESAVTDAQLVGLMKGLKPGTADLAVQSHSSASTVRETLGVSGKQVESAHVAPTSAMKDIAGYGRGRALTALLPKEQHAALDASWKRAFQNLRRGGRLDLEAGEAYTAVAKAIQETPGLEPRVKGALTWKLHQEMFQEAGLTWYQKIRLPYSNITPP